MTTSPECFACGAQATGRLLVGRPDGLALCVQCLPRHVCSSCWDDDCGADCIGADCPGERHFREPYWPGVSSLCQDCIDSVPGLWDEVAQARVEDASADTFHHFPRHGAEGVTGGNT